jgi:hypothetical protein
MKLAILATAAAMLVATVAPSAAQTYRSDVRQYRQQERIERGIRRGDLTPREARRLVRQQRRIERVERRARYYNNGRIDPRSAARIDRMQDRANRTIRNTRNNYRTY